MTDETNDSSGDLVVAEIEKLKENNLKLTRELKEARRKLVGNETVESSKYDELEMQFEALKKNHDALQKKYETETEALKTELQAEKQGFNEHFTGNVLSEELNKAGITQAHNLMASKAILAGQVVVDVVDGKRIAKIGDKPVSDFIKDWTLNDIGKNFVAASDNSGGGAPGSSGNGAGTKQIPKEQFDNLSPYDQMQHVKSGGEII